MLIFLQFYDYTFGKLSTTSWILTKDGNKYYKIIILEKLSYYFVRNKYHQERYIMQNLFLLIKINQNKTGNSYCPNNKS